MYYYNKMICIQLYHYKICYHFDIIIFTNNNYYFYFFIILYILYNSKIVLCYVAVVHLCQIAEVKQ